jgi:protein TonB
VVSENPVVTRQETKPDYAVAEPKSAAVTEMRKAQADTPVGAKIVTAAPNAEVKTEEKAGSGEETKKPSVSTVYLQSIYQKIEKYKRYPRLARDRGIEGSILVEFVLDSNGKLLHNQVLRSSGFKILDREALLTIRRAAPFPKLPAHQMAGQVVLKIPITFELKD